MRAVLIGSGEINDYSKIKRFIYPDDFIICCDGGVKHLFNMEIMPNIILGDFDSAENKYLNYYKEKNIEFQYFPRDKDNTDMELGLLYAMSNGYKEVVILGGIGSRLDHTLGNIGLLSLALENDVYAYLANENTIVYLCDNKIYLNRKYGRFISLIPISPKVDGIITAGLVFTLNNETLKFGAARGISNEFISKEASVSINDGLLCVIQSDEV